MQNSVNNQIEDKIVQEKKKQISKNIDKLYEPKPTFYKHSKYHYTNAL